MDEFVHVNFDLLADNDDLNADNILQDASPEEIEQVESAIQEVVEQDMSIQMEEDEAFDEASSTSRHVKKTEAQIDKLADNAHRDSTKNQTKWAVNVFKGTFAHISVKFFTSNGK